MTHLMWLSKSAFLLWSLLQTVRNSLAMVSFSSMPQGLSQYLTSLHLLMLRIYPAPHTRTTRMRKMQNLTGATLVLLSTLGCGARASDGGSAEIHTVLPSIQERLSQRVINGTLIQTNGREYLVRDVEGGVERTVQVDQRTKLDPVATGETVRIYITDDNHATTVQRITK